MHRDRLSAESEGAFKDVVAPIASELVEQFRGADRSVVTVPRDWILSEFVLPSWALSTLYVLAALTFPHEASARYPAPMDAPTDAIEAAATAGSGFSTTRRRWESSRGFTNSAGRLPLYWITWIPCWTGPTSPS